MPLNTREGVADAPIEPGARTLCEPCVTGPRLKLWRLIVPWKPLPFETPDDLHALALLEDVDLHVLADLELAGLVAELAHVLERAGVGLLQVAEQRLVERLLGHLAEGELDGLVAVAVVRADAGDPARPGLEDGDALDAAVLAEDLGHPELPAQQRGHQTSWIWMSTPAGRWSSRWSESTVFGVG